MSLRLATFNVENLMNRFDFSGYRNQLNQDWTLEVERFPRAGWDRPKASDHCPVAVTLDIV